MEMESLTSYGAFMEKFTLQPICSSSENFLPLNGLTFAVKDIFDVEGHITGFGNPDWAKTHSASTSTAPTVVNLLKAGATCFGNVGILLLSLCSFDFDNSKRKKLKEPWCNCKTVMDEMAYSINGENFHYGTPVNPVSPDRVPGGSSSGSAVVVGAKLVDFSLGTDTGGSVRVPASYCGIYGIRPSHGVVSTAGVIPMAQSFDTVGWFARDPLILKKVGRVLLQSPQVNSAGPTNIIVAEDCFKLLDSKSNQLIETLVNSVHKLYGSHMIKYASLGDYIEENVPSLKKFMTARTSNEESESYIPSLLALSTAMRLLQKYEFKENHGEWVSTVNPSLGPGIAERVWDALKSTDENIDVCHSVKSELVEALADLLGDSGILAIPTVPGPPPKLKTEATTLEEFRANAFSLLSIAGVSGFCQVNIPLGIQDNLPMSVSLLANHGSDWFLLNVVEAIHNDLKE